ncbi:hypothetical protein D9M68_917810 [compost metagenome]
MDQLGQHFAQASRGRHGRQVLDVAGDVAHAVLDGLFRRLGGQHACQALAVQHRRVLVVQRAHAVHGVRGARAHGQRQARRVYGVRGVEHLGAVHVLQERLHVVIGRIQQNVFRRAFLH